MGKNVKTHDFFGGCNFRKTNRYMSAKALIRIAESKAASDLGRFVKIGIPAPEVMGPFVGTVEIVCGSLIILGLLTRLADILLIVDMCVALISTKLPILLGHGLWRFSLSKLPSYGFWSLAHEARTDLAMLLGSTFLLIAGAGVWSLDARLAANKLQRDEKRR